MKKLKRKSNNNSPDCVYLPLSPLSQLIAEVFYSIIWYNKNKIVNNYEINQILGKYLCIWSNGSREVPYILRSTLSSKLKLYDCGILNKFFNGIYIFHIIIYSRIYIL